MNTARGIKLSAQRDPVSVSCLGMLCIQDGRIVDCAQGLVGKSVTLKVLRRHLCNDFPKAEV